MFAISLLYPQIPDISEGGTQAIDGSMAPHEDNLLLQQTTSTVPLRLLQAKLM